MKATLLEFSVQWIFGTMARWFGWTKEKQREACCTSHFVSWLNCPSYPISDVTDPLIAASSYYERTTGASIIARASNEMATLLAILFLIISLSKLPSF